MSTHRFVIVLGLLVAGWGGGGCSSRPAPAEAPLLVLGVDGFEWSVAIPLLRAGEMPHLLALMQRGAYGMLETFEPTRSPIIWTTIATGKTLEHHGILDFVRRRPDGPPVLYTNTDRQTKALWNIASEAGQRVAVIGWWITWPVEPVNGLMVSQTNTLESNVAWKGALLRGRPGQVHPPDRQDEMMVVLERTDAEVAVLQDRYFGVDVDALGRRGRHQWVRTDWALRADTTYSRIAEEVLAAGLTELTMVYIGGCDVVGHRFWEYMQPELYSGRKRGDIDKLKDVIPDYYRYADELIGRLVRAAGPNANIMIVSDHGMRPVNDPDTRYSAHHRNAPPGVFVAAGPAFASTGTRIDPALLRRGQLGDVGHVLDIAPTILRILGLPPAADMPGRPLEQLLSAALRAAPPPPPVATYDTPEFLANRPRVEDFIPDDAERLRQLADLGYIGAGEAGDPNDGGGADAAPTSQRVRRRDPPSTTAPSP